MEQKMEDNNFWLRCWTLVACAVVAIIGFLVAGVATENLIIAQSTDPIATACALASPREFSQQCHVVLQRGAHK